MLIQKLIVIQENPCLPAYTQTLLENKESRTLPVPKNVLLSMQMCFLFKLIFHFVMPETRLHLCSNNQQISYETNALPGPQSDFESEILCKTVDFREWCTHTPWVSYLFQSDFMLWVYLTDAYAHSFFRFLIVQPLACLKEQVCPCSHFLAPRRPLQHTN